MNEYATTWWQRVNDLHARATEYYAGRKGEYEWAWRVHRYNIEQLKPPLRLVDVDNIIDSVKEPSH